jgi:hypothetical protein
MWAAMALTALSLAPSQAGDLKLTNARTTYGVLGQERKSDKFLPGDVLVVAFDIEGLKVKDDGKVKYGMGMELTKKGGKGKALYKTDPQPLEALNTLGGTTLPAFALSIIGTDTEPGDYTLTVTVNDREAKTTKTLIKAFQVLKQDLGFVRVRLTSSTGEPVPNVAVPGQRIMLNCSLVGFDLGKKDKLPHVTFEMQVYDENGRPTVPRSFKGDIKTEIKDTPGMMNFLPMALELNRAGRYKIHLKAKCNHTNKEAEEKLDLRVLEQR